MEETDDILVMSCDGKGIVMREEDLRKETRRAAERSRKKGKKVTRLKPGEKSNRKRMSTVAAIYCVPPNIRTAEDVMGLQSNENNPTNENKIRPRPINKRVFASIEKGQDEVIGDMLVESMKRDPDQRRTWALLLDGAEYQLDLARYFIEEAELDVVIILDFIHVLEYVWRAAHCFHSVGSEEAEEWVKERALKILQGKASQVAVGMKRDATSQNFTDKKRGPIDKCANYILKLKECLCYDKYLAAGLPIATGVIEGACRYLVKDRMELTGARWRLKDAEAVLKLRSLRASGDFDEYWKFHQKEEYKRHYESCSDEFALALLDAA